MSFYVTLPSTASADIYPDNTTSSFTTNLISPLPLEGSWQVGLAGFSYRQSISSVIGKIAIYKLDSANAQSLWYLWHSFDVMCYEGETYDELLYRINNNLSKVKGDVFRLAVSDDPFIVLESPTNYELRMSGVLTEILGIPKNLSGGVSQIANNYSAKGKISRNEFFFFYTDIIEDQYVGDSKAKLLDTMSLRGEKGESVSVAIASPHYVDLTVTEVTSININIRDSMGEYIHFDNLSRVIVKLHFRPKNYE